MREEESAGGITFTVEEIREFDTSICEIIIERERMAEETQESDANRKKR